VFVFLAGSSDRASEKRSSSVWSLLLAVVLFSPHFFFLVDRSLPPFLFSFLLMHFPISQSSRFFHQLLAFLRAGTMMFAFCAKDWFFFGLESFKTAVVSTAVV
jgi:hypothetical protein